MNKLEAVILEVRFRKYVSCIKNGLPNPSVFSCFKLIGIKYTCTFAAETCSYSTEH